MIHDVFLITIENYPTLFKAFEMISHDAGNGAGHKNYSISLKWKEVIEVVEYNLKVMLESADSDFECLCIGDEDDRNRIVREYKIEVTDKLLQDFFEEL